MLLQLNLFMTLKNPPYTHDDWSAKIIDQEGDGLFLDDNLLTTETLRKPDN